MTQTLQHSALAKLAAAAAMEIIPIADTLEVGELINDPATISFAGMAVTARFTGNSAGDVLVAVEQSVVDALRSSPLGSLDLTAALAPALAAAADVVGQVVTGPGQLLEPGLAVGALLTKPDSWVVPLLHGGIVRALVGLGGIAQAVTDAREPSTPHYPTSAELERGRGAAGFGSSAQSAPTTAQQNRHGLDLLRDVNMEVTAQIGSTRMTIEELLTLTDGTVVELDRAAGAPADLLVNGHLIARGEVVVIDENFALRITEIVGDETAPTQS